MILKILKFFIFVTLLCFFAMVIAELDAGRKNLQYARPDERGFNYVSKISAGCFAYISSLF